MQTSIKTQESKATKKSKTKAPFRLRCCSYSLLKLQRWNFFPFLPFRIFIFIRMYDCMYLLLLHKSWVLFVSLNPVDLCRYQLKWGQIQRFTTSRTWQFTTKPRIVGLLLPERSDLYLFFSFFLDFDYTRFLTFIYCLIFLMIYWFRDPFISY